MRAPRIESRIRYVDTVLYAIQGKGTTPYANGGRVTRCQPLARRSDYSRRPGRATGRMIVIAAITGPIYEWN